MSDRSLEVITDKIIVMFGDDFEAVARLLHYLNMELKQYGHDKDSKSVGPAFRMLMRSVHIDAIFKHYAERLIDDTKTAEANPGFLRAMQKAYAEMMKPTEMELRQHGQGFDVARLGDPKIASAGLIGFGYAWDAVPAATRATVLKIIPMLCGNSQLATRLGNVVGLASKFGGALMGVALAGVHLTWEAIRSIRSWWKGEISGLRCAKNITDSFVTVAAGAAGGIGGAAIGSLLGPVGTIVGGIVGGVAASSAAACLVDRLTQLIFGLPKTVALENAYRYFGVRNNASNNEVNTAYRSLCLQHHPDKGGDAEKFNIVQYNFAVIKAARGELY